MDMMDMNHSMGGVSMGDGIPGLFYMQQMYWKVAGAAVAFATAINMFNEALAVQRLYVGSAKPKTPFLVPYATATAITREITYVSLAPTSIWRLRIHFPPLGQVIILLANLVLVMILCFYRLNSRDQWQWEDIGYRTGFIGLAQLPLIFLLSAKKNIIGALTGVGYERLNYLHRWTARTLWLTATTHMGFWFRDWARYDYIKVKLTTDPITQRGFASWCILTFIVCSSAAPIRKWKYEIFVLQHLVSFSGFIAAVLLHVPDEVRAWVWVPVGLFAFDRLMRARRVLYSNCTYYLFHPFNRNWAPGRCPIGNQATLMPLPGNVTRITIEEPLIRWKPGQHVFFACHSICPLQSHPFTIASIMSDKRLEFLVRGETGGTKKLLDFAIKNRSLPTANTSPANPTIRNAFIEGPYGKMRPLRQFDTLVFVAGGMGATFTMPLLRDVVEKWKNTEKCFKWAGGCVGNVTRRIRFVWVIKARDRMCWFPEQLESVVRTVNQIRENERGLRLEVEITVYITCDPAFTKDETVPTIYQPPRQTCDQLEEIDSATATSVSASTDEKAQLRGEKEKGLESVVDVVSISSTAASTNENPSPGSAIINETPNQQSKPTCGPNGTCCCTTTIEEDASASSVGAFTCTCGDPPILAPSPAPIAELTPSPDVSSLPTPQQATLTLLSGRPDPRGIIRRSLERAEGETAVIVCGPRSLREEVRRSVVYLSDERAIHKGTGAQGVWLHVEGFEY